MGPLPLLYGTIIAQACDKICRNSRWGLKRNTMSNRYIQPLRIMIQWAFLLFCLYLGISFYRFVNYFRLNIAGPPPARPDGVEAFLPISALLSLKDWLLNGSINPVHPAAL